MDTFSAFAMGEANRGKEERVFDWKKAAQIIKERGARHAIAGLSTDMEYTSGEILRDGVPVPRSETYTYLASTWATPVLVLDHSDDEIPCYTYENETEYTAKTYWPEDALNILNS